jgi:hypothetical protein
MRRRQRREINPESFSSAISALRSFLENLHFADERYHPSQPLAWTIEEHESFMVRDATGQALGYFLF